MKAKKDNKVYRINTEQEKQRYLKEGYDIFDDEGNAVEYSPLKKVKYGDYDRVVKELAVANAEIERLKQELEEKGTKAAGKKAGE